ncbi:MAG: hypothetical protein V1766_07725 [Pseudomonadota bacterium]
MAEDLLDYWVRLIKTVFPANAWIISRFFNNDHLIQIDWKLENDPKNPNKRSKKIEIIIKERAIENYLDKNKKDRELSDIMLKEFICERYNHLSSNDDIYTTQYVPRETWLISKDILNGKPSFDAHP